MGYVPGPYDVICAKGREAKVHEGNIRYKSLIRAALPTYKKAATKVEKSLIVNEIVDAVRTKNCYGAGFVKFDVATGCWYDVGDHVAREKTGQALRDGLHSTYKSSARAKKRRQKASAAAVADDFMTTVLKRNSFVSRRIEQLNKASLAAQQETTKPDTAVVEEDFFQPIPFEYPSSAVNTSANRMSLTSNAISKLIDFDGYNNNTVDDDADYEMHQLFSQTNLEILEAFKRSNDLFDGFVEAEHHHKYNKM